MSQQNKRPGDLIGGIEKSGGKQDYDNLDDVRVPAFKEKKLAIITATAIKPVVDKLLTIPNNIVLEEKRYDEQDVNEEDMILDKG